MFASKTTSTVTLHDDAFGDVVVTIQKLSGHALEEAEKIRSDESMILALKMQSAMAVPALAEAVAARVAMKASAPDQPAAAVDVQLRCEQRYKQYDRNTVVRSGVRSWLSTAKEKLPSVQIGVQDLDDASAEQLHRAILDLTLPAIDVAAQEDDRKNG